jgi:hypothetical protein
MASNVPHYQRTVLGALVVISRSTDELQEQRSHSGRVLVELAIDNRFHGAYDVVMLPNGMVTYAPEYAIEGTQPLSTIYSLPYTESTRHALRMVERFLVSVSCRYINASTMEGGIHD